ncbi:hypothetical protein [Hymenobacter sp. DG01]|uniref:hypothetical protein n=1 Tax=Hymenobacter sp. DG01 TaxID=2584940 RepID=UPI001124BA25|nr:hypothetical protein [Hymenobacter sp. DG01]
MKNLRILFAAVLAAFLAGPAAAQTLSLDQLLKLSALPAGLPLQKMTAALFPPEWAYRGHVNQTEETYWTANATDYDYDTETETPTSWVSLRPMPGGSVDVLFKTTSNRNIEPIRKELKRLKFEATPVTCLECQGERYTGPNYSVTLYTGKKGPFPVILVIHQDPPIDATPARPVQLAAPLVESSPEQAATPQLAGQNSTP